MSPPSTTTIPRTQPRVLLVNDDGPPAPNSPHILGLYKKLKSLGWKVSVVLPSSQKSWGSMQFSIQNNVSYWYYYPIEGNHTGSHPDTEKCWSPVRRPIDASRGEMDEWVLLDGSPTTCTNVGLFNYETLFGGLESGAEMNADAAAPTPFDLVISGPNFGRNTGAAFVLSSGTVGAAMAGSLSGVRSVAISYGLFAINPPTLAEGPEAKGKALEGAALRDVVGLAHDLSAQMVQKLWNDWELNGSKVPCYSINVPLCEVLKEPKICWTRLWESRYGQLFSPSPIADGSPEPLPRTAPEPSTCLKFAPNMVHLLRPKSLEPGTDVWALQNGWVSVTGLKPNYAMVEASEQAGEEKKADASPAAGGGWEEVEQICRVRL
ncbi:sure-like protein [Violaceomyces palustris]|uniref:Sure-like protein n=1 Tax=Violaceomyces palustris TaxID=1673888 RepID=A0ACD0P265_9BASI|nr:sure-like protein [Violaceomyces palustris]